MSIGKVDNSTTCFNWLEKATSEDYIKYYDYSKFTNEEKIVGSFGKVFRANWNDSDTVMVLKSSHKADIKELINELFLSKLIQEYNLESIDNEGNPHILYQAKKYFLEIFDEEDSMEVLIDKLILLLIKTQDDGNGFNETRHLINQCILLSNREAFKLFLSASMNNYPIVQVYLANCYKDGYGIELNYKLAFYWIQKAIRNKSIFGQLILGL
ncbi:11179_t:CDS:2 [Funneliformis geosporum]|uniref:11179_t:CDS:1 n=1 Tax=Funneliformis geosporum TaxID=1117311 RepID=A0A9W4SGM7_9GLOM|nr:11179_t:CDS:2 [Funneliformis geosporum]